MGLERFAAGARARRVVAPDPGPQADPEREPGPDSDPGPGPGPDDRDLPGPVARALDASTAPDHQACELCARPIGDRHRHVVDVTARSLQCACRPCALLFTADRPATTAATPVGVGPGRHRTVPEDHRRVEQFALEPRQWSLLRIPVDLAFVMEDTVAGGPVAFYPSPAGATQSELSLAAWAGIVAANPALADLRADVEAALVRVRDGRRPQAWVVPIDRCYELVGHLRRRWRGFGGGQEVRAAIEDFFDDLGARAGSPGGSPGEEVAAR